MSPLTKVFVVLLVFLSVVLSAGLVVFVNQTEDQKARSTQAEQNASRQTARASAAEDDARAARAERDRAVAEAQTRAMAMAQAVNAAQAEQQRLQNELQQSQLGVKTAELRRDTAEAAQRAALDTLKVTETALVENRKQNDDLQRKYNEALASVSDLTNRLDVMTRRYQKSEEDKVALNDELDRVRQQVGGGRAPVAGGGGAPAAPATPGAAGTPGAFAQPGAGGEAVTGVIRSVRNIQGVPYATISLGAADNIRPKMQLRVTDPAGRQFLGYLTIDQVDINEATGHLSGPSVGAVQQGSRVVTSWQ